MTAAAPPGSRSPAVGDGPHAGPPPSRAARLRRLLTATGFGPALLFIGLALAFLWPVTLGGKALLPTDALFVTPPWSSLAAEVGVSTPHNPLIADQILQNYSWKAFAREELRAGRLPLWNPNIFTGMPFLAAGQYAVLYPLGVLFWVLPLTAAYSWFTALHLAMAGGFMYLLLRVLGAGRAGAV
ncbi:MAG: hypothetical protein NTZ05_23265, partial [Chloroflexi bacterium]|nr:hypothetical protein [Chloroflexota bacterium]